MEMNLNVWLGGFPAAVWCEKRSHTRSLWGAAAERTFFTVITSSAVMLGWMMCLFWLHQHHQNYPSNHQCSENSLRKTAWDKRKTSESKRLPFTISKRLATSDQEADYTLKCSKWDALKMVWGRLCLCSLMDHQDCCGMMMQSNLWQVQLTELRRGCSYIFNSKHLMGIMERMQIHVDARSTIFEQHIDTKVIFF